MMKVNVVPPPPVYATWAATAGVTLTNGDLTATYGNARSNISTIGKSSGKWQWEYETLTGQGEGGQLNGFALASSSRTNECGFSAGSFAYAAGGGNLFTAGVGLPYGAGYTTEIITVTMDLNDGLSVGTITMYKGGVSQGAIILPSIGIWYASSGNNGTTVTLNSGGTPLAFPVVGFNPGLYT